MQIDWIKASLARSFGIVAAQCQELSGGLDAQASNWRISAASGDEYVLKISTSLNRSLALSELLVRSGITEVVAPIPTVEGELAYVEQAIHCQLFPFVDGANGFETPLLASHWRQIGCTLRKIHDLQLGKNANAIPAETFAVKDIPEFYELSERVGLVNPSSPVEEALAACLRVRAREIDTVLTSVQELGLKCKSQNWALVPCHADLHVGNILVTRGSQVRIIDWDSSRMAPRECDLIFFLGGGITGHGSMPEASFLEGYGSVDPNEYLLTYYRFARAAEDIVSFTREAADPLYGTDQSGLKPSIISTRFLMRE